MIQMLGKVLKGGGKRHSWLGGRVVEFEVSEREMIG